MRNFRFKKRTKPIFVSKAAFVNITLLAGVVMFVSLAAITGKLVSDGLVPDVGAMSTASPDLMATASPSTQPGVSITPSDTQSYELKINGKDFYFIQFGVFANEKNANTCAASVASRGGAGYIKNMNSNFYVFAMCYSDSNDAKKVTTQLKADGYSTMLKCFSHNGITLHLSGSETGISEIEVAFEGICSLAEKMEELVYKFDDQMIDRVEMKNQLRGILGEIEEYRDVFVTYSDESDIFSDASQVCSVLYEDISEILKTDDDVKLSSEFKYVYVNYIFELIEYLDNVVIE